MALVECLIVSIGINLGTYHFTDKPLNDINPGVYVVCDNQVTMGVYRNSIRKTSYHLGYTHNLGPIDISAGVVTGYGKTKPYVMPSIKVDHARLFFIPPIKGVYGGVHLAMEF